MVRGILIGVGALLTLGFAAVTVALLYTGIHGTRLEFNGGELYYTRAVSEAEAKKLGDYLVKAKFYDGNPKTVQLTKTGSVFEVRMVVKPGVDRDPHYLKVSQAVCAELSANVFDNAEVKVHLCDDRLNTLRVVTVAG
jgi:hypothetical protein